jgi:hypothetical protein
MFDLQGRMVKSFDLDANVKEYLLDVNRLVPGTYLVQVQVDGENFTERLVVE